MDSSEDSSTSFPWHLGVRDAHCHPTDIMASIDRIAGMKAEVLTIMATRREDQSLVENVATDHGATTSSERSKGDDGEGKDKHDGTKIVPAFGWHPWFSHQLYDDRTTSNNEDDLSERSPIDATAHYTSVLTPTPSPSTSHEDRELLENLPTPLPLSKFLRETETRLRKFPHALIGEVGLDKGFRIPLHTSHDNDDNNVNTDNNSINDTSEPTPGSRANRTLSRFHVSMSHQKIILRAQLDLAAKLNRAVSLHSVQAHGVTAEVLSEMWRGHELPSKRKVKKERHLGDRGGDNLDKAGTDDSEIKNDMMTTTLSSSPNPNPNSTSTPNSNPYPPRICMHSYSGSLSTARLLLASTNPTVIFFSFSHLMNFGERSGKHILEVVKAIPDERVLVESDLNVAGEEMDRLLERAVRRICEVKGWEVGEGVMRLRGNWGSFVFGHGDGGAS